MTACPFTLCRGFFYPHNRPCTPKIVGTFYMQGYKIKEKTAIVPHCTPSFKSQWAPCMTQSCQIKQRYTFHLHPAFIE